MKKENSDRGNGEEKKREKETAVMKEKGRKK